MRNVLREIGRRCYYIARRSTREYKNLKEATVWEGKFVRSKEIIYGRKGEGDKRWEAIERTTRAEGSHVDAVALVIIVDNHPKLSEPGLMLISDYRPAVGKRSLEIPAGLIDQLGTGDASSKKEKEELQLIKKYARRENLTLIEETALRELREETGYYGEIMDDGDLFDAISPPLYSDLGLSSTRFALALLRVDMGLEINQNPEQREADKHISTVVIPCSTASRDLRILSEKENYALDASAYNIALGIQMAKMV
eukprot:TRINITY_DN1853_c0_g1_i6.p3 TRINITY_DN1853_c0_g1~~TRINITY_DN1853_c0_g1_i6.p3  ORF type:complete len:254 (+),score=54.63 TRINITY_DN1853_c0_g1_i6:2155-2916(+)